MGSGLRQSAGKSDLYLSIYLSIFVSLNLTFEQIDVGQALLKREKGLILTAARMGSGLRQSAGKSDLSIYLSIYIRLPQPHFWANRHWPGPPKKRKKLILTAARMGSGLRQSAGKSDLYLSIYLSIFVSLNLTFEQIDAGQALLKEKTKRVEG